MLVKYNFYLKFKDQIKEPANEMLVLIPLGSSQGSDEHAHLQFCQSLYWLTHILYGNI